MVNLDCWSRVSVGMKEFSAMVALLVAHSGSPMMSIDMYAINRPITQNIDAFIKRNPSRTLAKPWQPTW
jgi:hypothetical protein